MIRNIYTHIQDDINSISVLGEIEFKDEVNYLLQCMNIAECMVHITFYDAHIVPTAVIESILRLQTKKRCKVNVFQRCLHSYLITFGICCNCNDYQAIKKSRNDKDQCQEVLGKDLEESRIKQLLHRIYEKYEYDYRGYDINSIQRRLKRVMAQEQIKTLEQLEECVLEHRDMFEKLLVEFSINTTEFFRNPKVFEYIVHNLFMQEGRSEHIKIWCAGCSTGEEPYSLAILLHEQGLLDRIQIYATDINPYVIRQAQNGLFSVVNMDTNIANYELAGGIGRFNSYFDTTNYYMKIKDFIRKQILFFQHNLAVNSILEKEFQMILCRNVLIYFNQDLQNKVLKDFHRALNHKGILVLGKLEGLVGNGGYHLFRKHNETHKIYYKEKTKVHPLYKPNFILNG